MKLIVGLGNPGKEYEKTRHNIGFITIDSILEAYNFPNFSEEKKFKAMISTGEINSEKVILAKPLTFMNLSGEAVQSIVNFYKIDVSDVIIIQDDKDMEFLKTRVKNEISGSGGHNGIKSILQSLNTNKICRFKIGVANDLLQKMPTDKFVLGNFSKEELDKINENKPKIIEEIVRLIK